MLAAQDGLRPRPGAGGMEVGMSNYYDLGIYKLNCCAPQRACAHASNDCGHELIVAATSESGALAVLDAHHRGKADYYALGWNGGIVSVCYMRDASGLYA
jgi:hypothetical protein